MFFRAAFTFLFPLFIIENRGFFISTFRFQDFSDHIKGQILGVHFIKNFSTGNFRLKTINARGTMASNLFKIIHQEPQPIDEEKLKLIYTKHTIWDLFKMPREKYASYSDDEKMQMLKRFYADLVPVCYGEGKNLFCCKDCVFSDNGKRQDCLKCKVNVLFCDCSSHDEKLILPTSEKK